MSLPDPGEPIILADGTKINPSNGKVVKDSNARGGFVEIPSASNAQAIIAKSRRSIAELPVPPQQMNALSLVLFYSMYGISDQEISILTTTLSVDQIKNIRKLDVYQQMSNDVLKNVLEYEANDIRAYLQQNARNAAQKIVKIADEEEGALGFRASQDVLDRAGFRPADVHEHRVKMENSLKIEYIKKDDTHNIPAIDADFEVITDANR